MGRAWSRRAPPLWAHLLERHCPRVSEEFVQIASHALWLLVPNCWESAHYGYLVSVFKLPCTCCCDRALMLAGWATLTLALIDRHGKRKEEFIGRVQMWAERGSSSRAHYVRLGPCPRRSGFAELRT